MIVIQSRYLLHPYALLKHHHGTTAANMRNWSGSALLVGPHRQVELKATQGKPWLPDHCLHSANQLLCPTLSGVDGRRRGLVEVSLCGGPHFVTVMVRVAPFAVPNRPVSVATAAPCGKAGDHCPSDMGAAVLETEKAKPIKAGFGDKVG